MKIGFDAKRAFFNRSGLGNYSRNLLRALSSHFPDNKYLLYTPSKKTSLFNLHDQNFIIREPAGFLNRRLRSYWRSFSLTRQAKRDELNIFHGLSHELPYNINKSGIKTVVTIHDLIFLRFPELYKSFDRGIYFRKFKYACKIADLIIAISKQTASDIQEFFGVDKSRIEIVYQGCNPIFGKTYDENRKEEIRSKYGFPASYLLYVGSIEERKNLLSLLKAISIGKLKLPLVVIGGKTKYFKKIEKYINRNKIEEIFFLETILNEDLPAIYQSAEVFIYPSVFEGFGIPIIEALYSKTPVITTNTGCFPEAGGPSSIYVDSNNTEKMAEAIKKVVEDSELRQKMIKDGFDYVQDFNEDKVAENIINCYKKVLQYE